MPNRLTILGSSSALPTSARFPSAQVLEMLGRYFLIDCGEGTQIQLRRSKLPFAKISAVFISHMHGDHFYGIFGVIASFAMLGRKNPLVIYAPPELEEIYTHHAKVLREELPYPLKFVHTKQSKLPYLIYEDKAVEVYAFQLRHRAPSTGFLFKEKPKLLPLRKGIHIEMKLSIKEIAGLRQGMDITRGDGSILLCSELTVQPKKLSSFAYCSDTAYCPEISEIVKDVDLLYHEATFPNEMAARARETMHSTASQAAEIAKKANASKLVIGHFSARFHDVSIFLRQAKAVFPETMIADDLRYFDF
jgi:ribonuclease Z